MTYVSDGDDWSCSSFASPCKVSSMALLQIPQSQQAETLPAYRPSILFVDDEPEMAGAMQRNFRPFKVDLQVAYHGMQGIIAALNQHPDLIITDLQMPFASGEELIECLAANLSTRGTPIVIVTGRLDARLTSRLKKLGVVEVLLKPIEFETLRSVVERYIPLLPTDSA